MKGSRHGWRATVMIEELVEEETTATVEEGRSVFFFLRFINFDRIYERIV